MRIVPSLTWKLDDASGEPLDDRLLPLLEAIAASESLAAAVAECGISYRAAWGLLRDCHRKLGVDLVRLERGRGASLTQDGERLLAAQRAATQRLARILPGLAAEIGPRPPAERPAPAPQLRMAASHDLALAALSEVLAGGDGLELEVSFMGSLLALREFGEGRADVAGFHVPIAGAARERKPFLRWLRDRRDRLIRFIDREQGLILPRGNPAQVRHFRDIAAKRLRFVNRQPGSGTRLLIDELIADGGLESTDVDGYRREEFTHAAVAATVASGGADAGFGLRAAAAEYRLAFVPLVRERYFLAVRARDVETAAVTALIDALRSQAFVRLAKALPGYRAAGAGSIVGVEALRESGRDKMDRSHDAMEGHR
jgi:putative molybdopterin biosynthesis protein